MCITLIPGVSPVIPATSILPLVFVLTVAAVKDAIEDYHRYRADRQANGTPVIVVRDGAELTIRSDEVVVGDIVKMERNREVVADIVVLSSALDDGICYIETSNLDGETNIKPKQAIMETRHLLSPATFGPQTAIRITGDAPNPSLVKWEGVLDLNGVSKPLSLQNIIFRGCRLKNTPHAYGIATYCGTDTKLFRNLKKKVSKFSSLDKKLNKLILVLLLLQQCLIAILAGMGLYARHKNEYPYLSGDSHNDGLYFVLMYCTYFVLLSYMMPISLFVSMELCKSFQAKFMELDVEMATDKKSMKVKTSNLNEELSQVRYIFTDKTGTLTENEMRFHSCAVQGFYHNELENSGGILRHLASNGEYASHIDLYMKSLALCHGVVCSHDEDTGALTYEGQSTDEVAFVEAARSNGYVLKERTSMYMTVDVQGQPQRFEILAVCEFNSDRKRMSVVVREPSGQLLMLSKGADATMMPLLRQSGKDDAKWQRHIVRQLDMMAKQGLRTLVVGYRILEEGEFASWKATFDEAALRLEGREAAVAEACALLEHDLALVGCSGVEDRLQDKVPETIAFFLAAGVVIWMLTGDKRETAVNIAASSRLLNINADTLVHITAPRPGEDIGTQIDAAIQTVSKLPPGQKSTIVIDGAALELVLGHEHEQKFQDLGLRVSSAICCRVTPMQKARVVALFQRLGVTAVSVGDGANDVSMIQEAKVGVGIMGLEGSQAELASDFAVPKFKHLVRLLAVQGRFSLVRNAILIQFSFYKNLVLSINLAIFGFYNYSGQTPFDSWSMAFFNVLFTSIPPLIGGVFEKDLPDHVVQTTPALFTPLSRGQNFNWGLIGVWGFSAVAHALLIFFLITGTYPQDDAVLGHSSDIWAQGTIPMTVVITVVLVKNAVTVRTWTWIPLAGLLFSYALYYIFIVAYSAIPLLFGSANYYFVAYRLMSQTQFYLWVLLFGIGVSIPDIGLNTLQRQFFPTLRDRYRAAAAWKPRRISMTSVHAAGGADKPTSTPTPQAAATTAPGARRTSGF
eukprot:RCo007274